LVQSGRKAVSSFELEVKILVISSFCWWVRQKHSVNLTGVSHL